MDAGPDGQAVGAFRAEPAQRSGADGRGQRRRGGAQLLRVISPGQQGPPASLHVEHKRPVDQHDQRPRLAARPVRGRCLGGAVRPRQRRPVRLRRIGGREHHGPFGRNGRPGARLSDARPVSQRPHPVHGAGQGELGRAEALHEVAAPTLAGLLHGP